MENLNLRNATLVRLRKELHQHPEVSGKEVETAKRITAFLENYPPDEIITGIAKTGIIALYKGKKVGKTVVFRCELDALPIEETNTFDHQSLNKGVSHKCGHDGHMTILCGLAMELHDKRPESGTVILLFQPAEEDGSGAQKVLNDLQFKTIQPDCIFAFHNLPGFSLGQIVVKDNTFSCAVNSIIIRLTGKTAHAGEPEKGLNPALAIAAIISDFNERMQPNIAKKDYCLITPIYISMGKKAYGVSAGQGEIHFTVRCNNNRQMKIIEEELENTVHSIALQQNLKTQINWTQSFKANENHLNSVKRIKEAAQLEEFDLFNKATPFSWGEDFGLFTQHIPGAMFGIGAGKESPALHNPDYDFPDAIIPIGVQMFHQIYKQILNAR